MRVFVSFFKDQQSQARRIIEECRSRQIEAEAKDLSLACYGKDDVQEELIRQVRSFDIAVIIWSKKYSTDSWLQTELFALLTVQRDRKTKFIYPLVADNTPLPATLGHPSPITIKGRLEEGIKELLSGFPEHNNLFVIMKFNDADLDSTYRTIMKPTSEKFGFKVIRIDEVENSNSITQQILQHIEGSGAVLCDLTEPRPNVYFEAGYALAMQKELILCAKTGSNIHFDLKDRGIIFWDTPEDLLIKLTSRFESIMDRRRGYRLTAQT